MKHRHGRWLTISTYGTPGNGESFLEAEAGALAVSLFRKYTNMSKYTKFAQMKSEIQPLSKKKTDERFLFVCSVLKWKISCQDNLILSTNILQPCNYWQSFWGTGRGICIYSESYSYCSLNTYFWCIVYSSALYIDNIALCVWSKVKVPDKVQKNVGGIHLATIQNSVLSNH